MNPPKACAFRSAGLGFTLLEVLIAVLVLSIGLLGMSALTLNVLRANDSSYFQSQAAILDNVIIDDMRANAQAEINSHSYNTNYNTTYADPGCDTAGTTCTAAQIATYDLWAWKTRIQDEMPLDASGNSGGQITFNSVTNPTTSIVTNQVTVTVTWVDSRAIGVFGHLAGNSPTYSSVTLTANIP